jgi:hypothetical protein
MMSHIVFPTGIRPAPGSAWLRGVTFARRRTTAGENR